MRRRSESMIGAALDDVAVQALAPQIEEAVLEADLFGIFLLAEHRHRQFGGRPQHFDVAREHLDGAGRQVGIVGAGGPRRTRPSTLITHSERSVSAVAKAGESGSATTCVTP